MFNIGPTELVVILILALIIFGPGKLPEVGKAIGRSINEFKRATRIADDDDRPASGGGRPAAGTVAAPVAAPAAAPQAPAAAESTAPEATVPPAGGTPPASAG